MSDDDGLPLLTRAASPPLPTTTALRKRSRGHSSSHSSDAAFFSSDDLAEACADNYSTLRRKKQYRGHWWESGPISRLQKRTLKQPVDSGVFMSSDSSGGSSSEDGFNVASLPPSTTSKFNNTKSSPFSASPRKPELQGEDLARRIIQGCEENGNESIDLSNIKLFKISNSTLRPIRDFIRAPKLDHPPQSEDEYQSFAPSIKLFLSSNLLRCLPGEITNLSNLTVLSLRNNKITELPHSIGKLQNLVELNVSGNRLRYLPWELLQLVGKKLKNLYIFPNPLFKAMVPASNMGSWNFPSTLSDANAKIESMKEQLDAMKNSPTQQTETLYFSWLLKIQETLAKRIVKGVDTNIRTNRNSIPWTRDPIYLGHTPIAFFDFDGSIPHSSPIAPSTSTSLDVSILSPAVDMNVCNIRDYRIPSISSVPPLFSLALQTSMEVFNLSNLLLPDDTPTAISRGLAMAGEAVEDGVPYCSSCQHQYIIPRAEWIEYWHCPPDNLHCAIEELILPFLRRGCTWSCALPSGSCQ